MERYITRTAKAHEGQTFSRLQSVPGIGQILALVILYEMQDIARFPRVQDFVSYCRLVKCAKESNGKRLGTSQQFPVRQKAEEQRGVGQGSFCA